MNRSRAFLLFGSVLLAAGALVIYARIPRGDDVASPRPERTLPGSPRGADEVPALHSGGERAAGRRRVGEAGDAELRTGFRVVDRETRAPLGGVNLRAIESGDILAATDERGMASVVGRPPSRVVFEAPGYLRTFVEAGRAVAPGEVVTVHLWRDRFTVPLSLRFVSSEGVAPRSVRMRLECLEDPPPSGSSVPRAAEVAAEVGQELREAWQKHALSCALPLSFGELYHLGLDDAQRIYDVGSTARIRLVGTGIYLLEARSSDDEVARITLRVGPRPTEPFVVHLRPGAVLHGVVREPQGKGVAGAHVALDPPGIGVAHTRTAPDGSFTLGPLPGVPVVVHVECAGYEPGRAGPRRPGGRPFVVVLRPRATKVIRGIVRARPRLGPVAGARVQVRSGGRTLARTSTGEDGRFELRTNAGSPELVVEAPGFLRYVEVLEDEASPVTFDLLPATPRRRVGEGMTGLVAGVVTGPDGSPRPGVPVLVVPERNPAPQGIAGRRILEGGVLMLPHRAMSGPRGEFSIECLGAGPARVVAADGVSRVEDGTLVQIAPGRRRDNIVVRTAR